MKLRRRQFLHLAAGVAQSLSSVLVNRHCDRLDVQVAPPLSHGQLPRRGSTQTKTSLNAMLAHLTR